MSLTDKERGGEKEGVAVLTAEVVVVGGEESSEGGGGGGGGFGCGKQGPSERSSE